MSNPIVFLRLPQVLERRGRGRSSTHNDINEGLFPHPVSLGRNCVGWPEHEVQAVNAARLAGKSDDEIRSLVTSLEASRAQAC